MDNNGVQAGAKESIETRNSQSALSRMLAFCARIFA